MRTRTPGPLTFVLLLAGILLLLSAAVAAVQASGQTNSAYYPLWRQVNSAGFGSDAAPTAFSLVVSILATGPAVGIVGFLCLGAGVALGAPILYNAASRLPGMAPGAGLATFATFSFIGFLAGPPLIGFIGEAFGLRTGLGLVAGLSLVSFWAIRSLKL